MVVSLRFVNQRSKNQRSKPSGILAAIFILICIFGCLPALALPPRAVVLHSGWRFRALNDSGHAGVEQWHDAEVPGVVQMDLLRNKLIADPFYRDNEKSLQWIGLTEWEYQTEFGVDAATLARGHIDLLLGGLDTFADVYLNDAELLKADNMFRSWRLSAKDRLHVGKNTLRIVFHSPIALMMPKVKAEPYRLPTVNQVQAISEDGIATDPYTRKAPYNYGWDWGPRYVTEGIWQPVRLIAWDDLRIDNFHIRQRKISKDEAELSAEFDIVAGKNGDASLSIEKDGATGKRTRAVEQRVHLDEGTNHISIPFRVSNPSLWYPNGYGRQTLYKFFATLSLPKGNKTVVEDTAELRTGLRSLELRRDPDQWGKSFTFVVNGIPIFAKGADVIPFDSFPTRVTPAQHRQILEAARDAHMNMIRHWGGGYYESDDFYDICDELGIMIWQDFMFGNDWQPGTYAFKQNAEKEAEYQLRRLRDHPSIIIWSGNNETEEAFHWKDRDTLSPAARMQMWQGYLTVFSGMLARTVNPLLP